MNYEVSKELFEVVTGKKAGNIVITGDTIHYCRPAINAFNVAYNKYKTVSEFKEECVLWAREKGYSIVHGLDNISEEVCYIMKRTGYSQDYFYEQTYNYGTVFNACQYILDKDKQ